MRSRCDRTHLRLIGLLVLAAALIGISGIPRFNHGGRFYLTIGDIGWFGGIACAFVFLLLLAGTLVRGLRRRRLPADLPQPR